jgi:hypothetical protein
MSGPLKSPSDASLAAAVPRRCELAHNWDSFFPKGRGLRSAALLAGWGSLGRLGVMGPWAMTDSAVPADNLRASAPDYLRCIELIEDDGPDHMRKLTVEWGEAPQRGIYLGRIDGSPPGLPGGGMTGILPVLGVGARISGSTPVGGQSTPSDFASLSLSGSAYVAALA